MARPNDPVGQAESFETLRRKLLRQNRDLARVNSTQSLKIRQLENECARMLSENLDLRGQLLQLEKELEDSKSQRIADHALDIKAKLEAQMVEWGALLSTLGTEPPSKRQDQRSRRTTQLRRSLSRTSPTRKLLRDVAKDAEARAKEEGRLSPILEHQAHPRRTLEYVSFQSAGDGGVNNEASRNEIMAICTEADGADSSNSPDLGPLPMSRFVAKDPAPPNSPSKAAPPLPAAAPAPTVDEPESKKAPPVLQAAKATSKKDAHRPTAAPAPVLLKELPAKMSVAQSGPIKVFKSGSKRKFAATDEGENSASKGAESKGSIRSAISAERTGGKTLKELTSIRREAREKTSAAVTTRKPLAAKSTNEDVSSPKKVSGKAPVAAAKAAKVPMKPLLSKENVVNDQKEKDSIPVGRPAKAAIATPVSPNPEPTSVDCPKEPPHAPVEALVLSPRSPEPVAASIDGRDTPPPADISSNGETSRPSRRARGTVSYAEPNLRDKMRRSTKQMVDAVAGEGKFRASLRPEDILVPPPPSASSSKSKEAEVASELPASPLAEKGAVVSSASSDADAGAGRRKRRSSAMTTADSTKTIVDNDDTDTPETSITVSSAGGDGSSSFDVYDFTGNSPSKQRKDGEDDDDDQQHPQQQLVAAAGERGKLAGRKSRAGRRSSALHEIDLDFELPERPKSSAAGSRKRGDRASMHVVSATTTDAVSGLGRGDGPGGAEGVSTRNRGRRNSTMI